MHKQRPRLVAARFACQSVLKHRVSGETIRLVAAEGVLLEPRRGREMSSGDGPPFAEREEGVACGRVRRVFARGSQSRGKGAGESRERRSGRGLWGKQCSKRNSRNRSLSPSLSWNQNSQSRSMYSTSRILYRLVVSSFSFGRESLNDSRVEMVGFAQQDLTRFDRKLVAALDAQDRPDGLRIRPGS